MVGAGFLRGGEVGALPVAGRLRQGGIEPAGLGPLAVVLVVGQVASQFAQRGTGAGGFGAPAVAEGAHGRAWRRGRTRESRAARPP